MSSVAYGAWQADNWGTPARGRLNSVFVVPMNPAVAGNSFEALRDSDNEEGSEGEEEVMGMYDVSLADNVECFDVNQGKEAGELGILENLAEGRDKSKEEK